METECFSLVTDGLTMRKDVKRSLVIWPLSASILVVGIFWFALQADPGSKVLMAGVIDLMNAYRNGDSAPANQELPVSSLETSVPNSRKTHTEFSAGAVSGRLAPHPTDGMPSNAWEDLASIESWSDTSFELRQPAVAGIPAPSLNATSDIFGFEAELELSATTDSLRDTLAGALPNLEVTPAADQPVALNLDSPHLSLSNEIVIRIDPDVFFEVDRPLTHEQPADPLEADSPRMAERPTSDVALPPVYQKPDASVADLAPELADSGSHPKTKSANQFGLEEDLMRHSPSVGAGIRSSQADELPEVEEITRNDASSNVSEDSLSGGRALAQPRSATWPIAHRLIEQLDLLEDVVRQTQSLDEHHTSTDSGSDEISGTEIFAWSTSVRQHLSQLHAANRLGETQVKYNLDALRVAQNFAALHAESLTSRSRRVAWLQAAYSIERRLSVWYPIFNINSGNFAGVQHVGDDAIPVTEAIDRLESRLPATGDPDGWSAFLLLRQLREAFTSGDDNARQELAQTYLARMNWPNLASSHQEFLTDSVVTDVADAIRPWASGAIDYSALLHQIERAESNAIDLVTAEIAQSMQALAHSRHPQTQQLALNLDTHYRNANVRFSLSDALLNDLMPKLPTRDVPVRTTLLGSRVTGVSRVSSDLQLRLQPSPSTWELKLETVGTVSTRSVGRNGPAAINTSSNNPYSASTPISIKPTDIQLGNASVNVGGRSRLQGIDTTYDSWPLIGSLVNNFAENQYFEKASLADRIGRNRIRTQLGQEIDRSVNEKVDDASEQFSKTILGPLTHLRLEPKVVDMSSTSSRLIARYRMAGDWQLAAMTPRPRALSDNLFSVQMHQSAINNTLEQLIPQNEAMPIDQVLRQCYDVIGAEDRALPEDLPADTLIQFANHRPITIEIEEGKVWITMRIIRLQRDEHLKLRNFIVRAAYVPQVNGLSAELIREGHLSISGPGMSMRQRLPVRAIFNKVLSPTRPLTLTSAELLAQRLPEESGITQFELRDGWIGISVGKMAENQKVATRPAGIR